ncbi:hypothetical protein PM8797T_29997 [Gimesia maris DSM 8797]|nr:hypothetical protein PM8797T_29997 [Gimesia maris DSM 8797]
MLFIIYSGLLDQVALWGPDAFFQQEINSE